MEFTRVVCPHCGQALRSRKALEPGRRVVCSRCSTAFLPTETPVTAAPAPATHAVPRRRRRVEPHAEAAQPVVFGVDVVDDDPEVGEAVIAHRAVAAGSPSRGPYRQLSQGRAPGQSVFLRCWIIM